MTMRYRSTCGVFYKLSIIVSDFTSIISLGEKVKSGQKLYSFEKKKKNLAKLKNHMGRIYIHFSSYEIYFWILSEHNGHK